MSEENVVRRNPKNNRRKNTDGYRTDSGCFEDVDLQMASRHSPTSDSSSSETIEVVRQDIVESDRYPEERTSGTDHADACPSSPSLADECADDKDFHAILKRLSDITTDPGDLYRLCFSSRLSFCGHMAGNTGDEEGSFIRTREVDQQDNTGTELREGLTYSDISNESHVGSVEKDGKRCSNGQQCVELLSMISSFMTKAKEDPSAFNNSSLGSSLITQLSSLLSTLEETKCNSSQRNEGQSSIPGQNVPPTNPQQSTSLDQLPKPECVETFTSNMRTNEKTLPVLQHSTLNNHSKNCQNQQHSNERRHGEALLPNPDLESAFPLSEDNTIFDGDFDDSYLRALSYKQNRPAFTTSNSQRYNPPSDFEPAPTFSDKTNFPLEHCSENTGQLPNSTGRPDDLVRVSSVETATDFWDPNSPMGTAHFTLENLPVNNKEQACLEASYAATHLNTEHDETDSTSKEQSDNQTHRRLSSRQTHELLTSLSASDLADSNSNTQIVKTNVITKEATDILENDHPLSPTSTEDDQSIANLNIIDATSSTSSVTDADDDVVTNGRRAVKPYSWDYGDIWEKELERTRSSESFQNVAGEDHLSHKLKEKDFIPSFEEIRDELFHKAGFIHDASRSHSDGSKRRSRSADARSTLLNDRLWPENHNMQTDSPFVRTIYQNEGTPSTGMRKSWSSNHIGGDSVMVNVDWTHGRQMRVITGCNSPYQGFDNVRAQIIKEAVVRTSTFRGPKPWSVLKRRPSGLRRRSAGNAKRNRSFYSNTSDESRDSTRASLNRDSESSDSPSISATSSDCLTTATDDSSSVTSSQYYAASSLPSSPSMSNRSSACFSDTSTSDASDIRRVVFQSSSSEYVPREVYSRGYDVPKTHELSLDTRFGYMGKHELALPSRSLETTSLDSRGGPSSDSDAFNNGDSKVLGAHPSTLPRKWQGDHLMSPLLVRSDPDLSHITKVKFVGDSYSRSRISKNVRHTRNRSESPSPVGPRTSHTRVVSCEIVQSNKAKPDVYTKVSIAGSPDDEEAKPLDNRNTKLGHPNTRRSWHGQSPTRVRHSTSITPANGAQRYPYPNGSVTNQRHLHQRQQSVQDKKAVHATRVAVNDAERRMRSHWSAGNVRLPTSGRQRILSDTGEINRSRIYPANEHNVNAHPHFERNTNERRSCNFGMTPATFGRPSDVGIRGVCRRSPPDYFTAIRHSQGFQRHIGHQPRFPGPDKRLTNTDRTFSTGRNIPMEKNGSPKQPKEPLTLLAKETSFVGPSTFTKYQSSSNPSLTRTRRSRSLNEKDSISRRRLHDSDVYRRRAMEISQSNHNGGEHLNNISRCDSDGAVVRRPERRRRYSEGATRRPPRHDDAHSDGVDFPSNGVVDASYCDPHRESIREGTYSIESAESAHGVKRSDKIVLPYQMNARDQASIINKNGIERENQRQYNCSTDGGSHANPSYRSRNTQKTQIESRRSHRNAFVDENRIKQDSELEVESIKGRSTNEFISATEMIPHEMKHRAMSDMNDFAEHRQQHVRSEAKKVAPFKPPEEQFKNNSREESEIILTPLSLREELNADKEIEDQNDILDLRQHQDKFSNSCKIVEEIKHGKKSQTGAKNNKTVSSEVFLCEEVDEENMLVASALPVVEDNTSISQGMGDKVVEDDPDIFSSYKNLINKQGRVTSAAHALKNRTSNTVVTPPYEKIDKTKAVISAEELHFRNMVVNESNGFVPHAAQNDHIGSKAIVSSTFPFPYRNTTETISVVSAQKVLAFNNIMEDNEHVYPLSPNEEKVTTTSAVVARARQELPYRQVDEVDTMQVSPVSNNEGVDACSLVATRILAKENKAEASEIISPAVPNRKTHDKSNEVNVFIDYRNKRPVSIEYLDEDASFLKTLGNAARMSRMNKQNGGKVNRARRERNTNSETSKLHDDLSKRTEKSLIVEVTNSRLSRKDRHEQQTSTKKTKPSNNEQLQVVPVPHFQPSPEPYRRDSTIVYTDARVSFGSDTDSISRDSTVSSSGSDMTVILHDDLDISVDDLRQLTESGSKIGIEFDAIEVETGADSFQSPNGESEKMPPPMELSKNLTNYPKRIPLNDTPDSRPVLKTQTYASSGHGHSPEGLGQRNIPKHLMIAQYNESASHDNLVPSSHNLHLQSSCSSIASSRVSNKSTGTDSSKGRHSSKNDKESKGLFSRLKSFRNSFRGKKGDSTPFGKKSKNFEKTTKEDRSLENGSEAKSRSFSVTDANANLVSKPSKRTKSDSSLGHGREGTKTQGDLSRRSYDVFQHPNNSLRSVVGVKSVSSDHLNAYRITNKSPIMNEITAKSLEVLVETCI